MPATRSITLAAAIAVTLGGCAALPPRPYVTLPADSVAGAGDPTRAAILGTAYALGTPSSLAGRPAEAARTAANYEYLTVEIPNGPRWREFAPNLGFELAKGQQELRAALGIIPTAEPQAVIDSLYATSRALGAGDQPAAERILSRPIFQGGGASMLQRLSALPPLRQANFAANLTAGELDRMDRQGRGRNGGGGSGGGGRS